MLLLLLEKRIIHRRRSRVLRTGAGRRARAPLRDFLPIEALWPSPFCHDIRAVCVPGVGCDTPQLRSAPRFYERRRPETAWSSEPGRNRALGERGVRNQTSAFPEPHLASIACPPPASCRPWFHCVESASGGRYTARIGRSVKIWLWRPNTYQNMRRNGPQSGMAGRRKARDEVIIRPAAHSEIRQNRDEVISRHSGPTSSFGGSVTCWFASHGSAEGAGDAAVASRKGRRQDAWQLWVERADRDAN